MPYWLPLLSGLRLASVADRLWRQIDDRGG
jgi:hypothetical protein